MQIISNEIIRKIKVEEKNTSFVKFLKKILKQKINIIFFNTFKSSFYNQFFLFFQSLQLAYQKLIIEKNFINKRIIY